jgi:hypothetical protein
LLINALPLITETGYGAEGEGGHRLGWAATAR